MHCREDSARPRARGDDADASPGPEPAPAKVKAKAALVTATELNASPALKAGAAVLYAVLSFAIVFVNKFVLTVFEFPSFLFLALLQYSATTAIMATQKWLHRRRQLRGGDRGPPLFPDFSVAAIRFVMPLPLIYLFNTVAGLGATQRLNMPMFVLLRRFSIPMTMALEMYMLRRQFPRQVHGAVGFMVLGAVVAALNDLQVDATGYGMIMVNNVMTAAQGVVTRAVLDSTHSGDRPPMNSDGVLFYNAAVAAPLVLCIFITAPGQVDAVWSYTRWHEPMFVACLVASMLLGFLLNYSYFLCNKINSPLTTTIVGSIKNVVTSYLGMFIRDYHFTVANFVGVNIGVVGTAVYAYSEIRKVLELRRQMTQDTAEAAPEPSAGTSAAALREISSLTLRDLRPVAERWLRLHEAAAAAAGPGDGGDDGDDGDYGDGGDYGDEEDWAVVNRWLLALRPAGTRDGALPAVAGPAVSSPASPPAAALNGSTAFVPVDSGPAPPPPPPVGPAEPIDAAAFPAGAV